MKKLLSAWLALCLLAAVFTGCSPKEAASSSQPESSSSQVSQAASQPYQIGLVQYLDHAALNTAREAFMSRLEEWSYDASKVEIDYQNAQGDSAKLEEICQGFVEDGVDMIVAVSTPAAQAAVKAAQGTEVKVLFAAVNDPQKDLGIANLDEPEGSVTGVSDQAAVSATIDLAKQATPSIQTLGLLHSGEDAAVSAAAQAKTYAEGLGLTVVEKAVSSQAEFQQAAEELCGQADAILTASDNLAAASVEAIAQAASAAGKPWYAHGDCQLVQQGALAGVSVDYAEVGSKCADLAVQVMAGRPVAELPVHFFSQPQVYLNLAAQQALAVEFPAEALDTALFFS